MRYIELRDGLSVKKCEIEAVERMTNEAGSDMGSRVWMNSGKEHETPFFYMTLLEQLEMDEYENPLSPVLSKLDGVLDHATHSHQ